MTEEQFSHRCFSYAFGGDRGWSDSFPNLLKLLTAKEFQTSARLPIGLLE